MNAVSDMLELCFERMPALASTEAERGKVVMPRVTDPQGARFFQSERFFTSEGQWYFATREGVDFGPFTIRSEGEKALLRYIDTQRTMRRLRARDPALRDEGHQWNDQSVARAAREVADWRLDRKQRSDELYSDRSDEHK